METRHNNNINYISNAIKMIREMYKDGGVKPKNNAAVVTPKASPGFPGSTLRHISNVMLIVMENRHTPITDTTMSSSPKTKKGMDASVAKTAVLRAPKRSAKYPPIAFPKPMIKKSKKDCQTSLFHEIGMA